PSFRDTPPFAAHSCSAAPDACSSPDPLTTLLPLCALRGRSPHRQTSPPSCPSHGTSALACLDGIPSLPQPHQWRSDRFQQMAPAACGLCLADHRCLAFPTPAWPDALLILAQ